MTLFVIGIVVCIVLFVAMGFTGKEWKRNGKQWLALAGLVIIAISCIKTVPTGHTGIVTTFGKVENYTLDAGLHFLAPWQNVVKMDNRTQKETIEMSCFSSDIQEVTLTYTINYQIMKANAQNIYKSIGTGYFETIVRPKALEAVKGVFARYNAENLVSLRATLSSEIESVLVDDLKKYDIEIVATSIENIDFTDAFTDAVEAKQVAEQNKLRAQTEQEQLILEAEAEAQRQVIAAQADADAAIIKANNEAEIVKIQADSAEYQGQKDAAIMSNLGKQLNDYPELIQYYMITGWDGILPETMLSDDMNMLFNIDPVTNKKTSTSEQ